MRFALAMIAVAALAALWLTVQLAWRARFHAPGGDCDALAGRGGCGGCTGPGCDGRDVECDRSVEIEEEKR
jgi:hypothetical protein